MRASSISAREPKKVSLSLVCVRCEPRGEYPEQTNSLGQNTDIFTLGIVSTFTNPTFTGSSRHGKLFSHRGANIYSRWGEGRGGGEGVISHFFWRAMS